MLGCITRHAKQHKHIFVFWFICVLFFHFHGARLSMEELNPVMGNVNFDCDEFIRLEILHLGGVDLGREQAFIKKTEGNPQTPTIYRT